MTKEHTLVCPECGSDKVTTAAVTKYLVNSGEHWCHSSKTFDDDSEADCLECKWRGIRGDLILQGDKP